MENSNVVVPITGDGGGKIEYLSPSTIQSYRKCGRKVYLRKIHNLPDDTKYATTCYGTAMHETLDAYYTAQANGESISPLDYFENQWMDIAPTVTVWNHDSPEHLLEQGKLALTQYFQDYNYTAMDTEVPIRLMPVAGGTLPIIGTMDLVTTDGKVMDYKFGRGFSGSAMPGEYMLNMYIYYRGFEQIYGEPPKSVHILRQTWKGQRQADWKNKWSHKGFILDKMPIDIKWIEYYDELIRNIELSMRAGIWLPSHDNDGLCRNCAYRLSGACNVVLMS